ncbi:hypothetical protein ABK040_015409 [Willaertia magna]
MVLTQKHFQNKISFGSGCKKGCNGSPQQTKSSSFGQLNNKTSRSINKVKKQEQQHERKKSTNSNSCNDHSKEEEETVLDPLFQLPLLLQFFSIINSTIEQTNNYETNNLEEDNLAININNIDDENNSIKENCTNNISEINNER